MDVAKELKVVCRLLKDGSQDKKCTELTAEDYTPWEEVPEQQKQAQQRIWSERLSRNMSAYFCQHPDEYAVLIEKGIAERI